MEKKQIEKIEKSYVSVYVANDGTEFNDADECKKYETSARGVLMAKYMPLVKGTTNECALYDGVGCDDNLVDIVKVSTQEEADVVLQTLLFSNPDWTKDDASEWGKKRLKEATDGLKRSLAEGCNVLIGRRDWDDHYMWYYGTYESVVEGIAKVIEDAIKNNK